jgi:hypothetical protein
MFGRAAYCDVTPRDRPLRLAGYASPQRQVSAVLDTIEIAALLLEGGGRRCLMLGFDLMIVDAELADLIQSRLGQLGFRPAEVMLRLRHHFFPDLCVDAKISNLRILAGDAKPFIARAVELGRKGITMYIDPAPRPELFLPRS